MVLPFLKHSKSFLGKHLANTKKLQKKQILHLVRNFNLKYNYYNITWDYAKQCGVSHGVIRLPETSDFDITDCSHWESVHKRFIDFGNTVGDKECFRETFHDNGSLEMGKLLKLYNDNKINVPIRVDHVPTMAGESVQNAGYDALGRLFAIGHLKGLLESMNI